MPLPSTPSTTLWLVFQGARFERRYYKRVPLHEPPEVLRLHNVRVGCYIHSGEARHRKPRQGHHLLEVPRRPAHQGADGKRPTANDRQDTLSILLTGLLQCRVLTSLYLLLSVGGGRARKRRPRNPHHTVVRMRCFRKTDILFNSGHQDKRVPC